MDHEEPLQCSPDQLMSVAPEAAPAMCSSPAAMTSASPLSTALDQATADMVGGPMLGPPEPSPGDLPSYMYSAPRATGSARGSVRGSARGSAQASAGGASAQRPDPLAGLSTASSIASSVLGGLGLGADGLEHVEGPSRLDPLTSSNSGAMRNGAGGLLSGISGVMGARQLMHGIETGDSDEVFSGGMGALDGLLGVGGSLATMAESQGALSSMPGNVMGGLGGAVSCVTGGYTLANGIINNDVMDVVGGTLGTVGGGLGILEAGVSLGAISEAGTIAAAIPGAREVIGSAAAGFAIGRAADGPVGQGLGAASRALSSEEHEIGAQQRAQARANSGDTAEMLQGELGMRAQAFGSGRREETQRGLYGGTRVVERNDSLSDRLAEAMVGGQSTGAVSDEELDREYENGRFGRWLAGYLPEMLGGDRTQ